MPSFALCSARSPSEHPPTEISAPFHMDITDKKALRQQVHSLRWFHQIDFGNGIVSPGWIRRSKIRRMSRLIFDRPIQGKTVLDIGCWDGAYSIEAAKRGASRVLATDHWVWHHHPDARKCFDLARVHLAPALEVMDIDVPDISLERLGKFDVVLFMGVFYHLRH